MQNKKIENILLDKLAAYPKTLKDPDQVFNNIQKKLITKSLGWHTLILLPMVVFTISAVFIVNLMDHEKTNTYAFKVKHKNSFYVSTKVELSNKKPVFTILNKSIKNNESRKTAVSELMVNKINQSITKENEFSKKDRSVYHKTFNSNNNIFHNENNFDLSLFSKNEFEHKNLTKTENVQIDSSTKGFSSLLNVDTNKSILENNTLIALDNIQFDTVKNKISSISTYQKNDSLELLIKGTSNPIAFTAYNATVRRPYTTFPFISNKKQLLKMRKPQDRKATYSIFAQVSLMGIKNDIRMNPQTMYLSIDSLYYNRRSSEDRYMLALQTGLGCRITIKKYFSITAGVNYSYYSFFESIESPFVSSTPSGGYTKIIETIEMPVTLGVNIPIGRLTINIDIGAAPSFNLFASYFTRSTGSNIIYGHEGWMGNNTAEINPRNLNLTGNVLFSYSIINNLKVFGGFTSRYALFSLYNPDYSILQNSFGFGGKFGLEFQFGKE